jgi:hypothetical protein
VEESVEQDLVVMGVNIAAGKVYLGAVDCPNVLLLDDPAARLELAQHLDPAMALRDLATRFVEELRRLRPTAVAVVHPRRYMGWVYREAFNRVSLETAVMIAAAEQRVKFESIKQELVSKATETPLKGFPAKLAARLGITQPILWNDRALAFGAALALAGKYCR